jgi:integrase
MDDLTATHASLAVMKVDWSGIAVLLVSATGLRVSEFLALRWRPVVWGQKQNLHRTGVPKRRDFESHQDQSQ